MVFVVALHLILHYCILGDCLTTYCVFTPFYYVYTGLVLSNKTIIPMPVNNSYVTHTNVFVGK